MTCFEDGEALRWKKGMSYGRQTGGREGFKDWFVEVVTPARVCGVEVGVWGPDVEGAWENARRTGVGG